MKRKYSVVSSAAPSTSKKYRKSRLYRGVVSYGQLQRAATYSLSIANGSIIGYGLYFDANGFYVNGVGIAWGGNTDIFNTYDAYRIDKVRVEITYNQNHSSVTSVAQTLPDIYTAVDYDSAGANTLFDVLQKDGARHSNFGEGGGKKVIHTFRPKVAQLAYSSAAGSGYLEPKAGQWIGTPSAFADVPHYGLNVWFDDSHQTAVTGSNGYLNFYVRAWFSMKHSA